MSGPFRASIDEIDDDGKLKNSHIDRKFPSRLKMLYSTARILEFLENILEASESREKSVTSDTPFCHNLSLRGRLLRTRHRENKESLTS